MGKKPVLAKERVDRIGESVDQLVTLDVGGREFIGTVYPAVRGRLGRPLCMYAAEKLKERVRPEDMVFICSGQLVYPVNLPENDGPMGAAVLARALVLGLRAKPVIVADHAAVDVTRAACRGAGLNVVTVQTLKATERAASVVGFPVDEEEASEEADALFDDLHPTAIVAIEVRGRNDKGVYHALPKGRNMNAVAAKMAVLFDKAKETGALTIGIGDGGNEIGWGIVADVIRHEIPDADRCACGCGGGIADTTLVDVLVAASVSNWGAYGVAACLSVLLGNPDVIHDERIERRLLRECIDAGAVDGFSYLLEPKVDGLPEDVDVGFVSILRQITSGSFGWADLPAHA
jgi:hypothetical protein